MNDQCSDLNLRNQGFSGGIGENFYITPLGEVETNGILYYIFEYAKLGDFHESRIIVMKKGCRYMGSYIVDSSPAGIVDRELMFDVPDELGNTITFTGVYPPPRVVVNGKMSNLVR